MAERGERKMGGVKIDRDNEYIQRLRDCTSELSIIASNSKHGWVRKAGWDAFGKIQEATRELETEDFRWLFKYDD